MSTAFSTKKMCSPHTDLRHTLWKNPLKFGVFGSTNSRDFQFPIILFSSKKNSQPLKITPNKKIMAITNIKYFLYSFEGTIFQASFESTTFPYQRIS